MLPTNDHFSERHHLEYTLTADSRVAKLLNLIEMERNMEFRRTAKEFFILGFFTGIGIALAWLVVSWILA